MSLSQAIIYYEMIERIPLSHRHVLKRAMSWEALMVMVKGLSMDWRKIVDCDLFKTGDKF